MSQYKGLIPIVREETTQRVSREILEISDYIEAILEWTQMVNPQVAHWIDEFANGVPESREEMRTIGALVYRLLDLEGRLPIVSSGIYASMHAEIEELEGNEYFIEILERLGVDNHNLAGFISDFSLRFSKPLAVGYIGVLTYRLLESQAEANQLAEKFPC